MFKINACNCSLYALFPICNYSLNLKCNDLYFDIYTDVVTSTHITANSAKDNCCSVFQDVSFQCNMSLGNLKQLLKWMCSRKHTVRVTVTFLIT